MRRLFILLVIVLLLNGRSNAHAQSGGQIEIGQTVTGDLQNESGDHWIFAGTAGDVIEIRLDSTAFDPYVEFIGPDGTVLDTDDDSGEGTNARLRYALMATGPYTIVARSFRGGSGVYTLSIVAFEQPQGQLLAYGETRAAFLSNRPDGDDWTFTAGEGDIIVVIAYSLDFAPVLGLYQGTTYIEIDTYWAPHGQQFTQILPAGDYTINIAGGTGTYSLSLRLLERPTDWTLHYGDTVENYLGGEYLRDEWTFYGEAGRTLYLQWHDGGIGPTVHLYDHDEREIGRSTLDQDLIASLPYTGDYHIVLEMSDVAFSGRYTLTANEATVQPLEGTMEANSRRTDLIWTFAGQADEMIMLDLTSETSTDFDLQLYGPDGTLVAQDEVLGDGQNPKIVARLPVTGVYTVTILDWRYGFNENDYALTLTRAVPRISDQIAYGDQVHSILDQGSEAWHFTGAAGDTIRIVLDTETFAPQIALTDASGQELGIVYPDSEVLTLLLATLPTDGDYTITISNEGSLGDYGLYLDTVGDQYLVDGQTISSTNDMSYGDFWLFEGQAGDVVRVRFIPEEYFYPQVLLFSLDGEMLARSQWVDDEQILTYELPQPGTYLLVVHLDMVILYRHSDQQGDYILTLEIEEE